MNGRTQLWCATMTVLLVISCASLALGQGTTGQAVVQNMAEMKFVTIPPLPTCATASVQSGDPTKGPSIILARVAAGCSIPWHWHTPNENVMIASGVGQMEMKDGKPVALRAGGFAMMPSHHIHQFRCSSGPCALFIYSDAAFDIHYVDTTGKEIPPDQALKAVKETAATEMK